MYNVQNIFFYLLFCRYLLIREIDKTKNMLWDGLSNTMQDNLFMMTCNSSARAFYSILVQLSEDNSNFGLMI